MNENESLLLLKLLVALARPDLDPAEVFEVNGTPYVQSPEDGAIRLEVSDLIEEARQVAMGLKKLRKDFNAEANFQDWRSANPKKDEY